MPNEHANWNAAGTGGARPGAGKPLDPIVDRWRGWIRERLWKDRKKHYDLAVKLAEEAEPALLHQLYNKALPTPLDPTPGPPALPPFVLMIGTNGGHVALGYAPQGIVPGMETFMPPEVKALPAPAGNGHGGKRRPRKDRP